ncbi:MAG: RhuM family protein [Verrucomicrobiae bacterium]|nr:RhuM family protein [Verrucomicrobiae bacterium]
MCYLTAGLSTACKTSFRFAIKKLTRRVPTKITLSVRTWNPARAIQFRQWATVVLRDFAIRGYVLDKERLNNGAFLSKEYYVTCWRRSGPASTAFIQEYQPLSGNARQPLRPLFSLFRHVGP